MDLKNHTVNFRICDIFYPDFEQILFQLHGNDILRGKVVDVSDAGMPNESYVEVKVPDLTVRLIVPLERILSICE